MPPDTITIREYIESVSYAVEQCKTAEARVNSRIAEADPKLKKKFESELKRAQLALGRRWDAIEQILLKVPREKDGEPL